MHPKGCIFVEMNGGNFVAIELAQDQLYTRREKDWLSLVTAVIVYKGKPGESTKSEIGEKLYHPRVPWYFRTGSKKQLVTIAW